MLTKTIRPISIATRTIPTARLIIAGFPRLPSPSITLHHHLPSRSLHSTTKMSDQYSAAASAAPSLSDKLATLRAFLKTQKAVILTTRAQDGALHARVMAIAEITPDWKFRFIYDKESHKDQEVEQDSHVNLAADGTQQNTGWVSIAGKASRVEDKAVIEKLWDPTIKAWFADKGDGVHDGTPNDPRVVAFEVKVDEIRHFHQEKTTLGTVVDIVSSAISGSTATPGSIRTITGEEIASAWAKNELREP